jgi:hypothetical protein
VVAVAHQAIRHGHHHLARQVANYDWVNAGALHAARDIILRALAGRAGEFEVATPDVTIGDKTIVGFADFVETGAADDVVWEFKLGELCAAHELQLACYLALRGGGEGRLMSILNCETRAVRVDAADALPLLTIIAERAAPLRRPVSQVIADFDAGVGVETWAAADAAEPRPENLWVLDDVFC